MLIWIWNPNTHCRHPYCRDTNWGGSGRVHMRGSECPPDPTGKHLHVLQYENSYFDPTNGTLKEI